MVSYALHWLQVGTCKHLIETFFVCFQIESLVNIHEVMSYHCIVVAPLVRFITRNATGAENKTKICKLQWICLLMANLPVRKLHHYNGQFFLCGIGTNCILSSSTEFWYAFCENEKQNRVPCGWCRSLVRLCLCDVLDELVVQLCGTRFLQQITCRWIFDDIFSQPVHTGSRASFTLIILRLHACKELSLAVHFVVWCSLCLLCAHVCMLHRYVLLLFIPAT